MQSSTNTSDPLPMGGAIVMWCQTTASLTLSAVPFYFFWQEVGICLIFKLYGRQLFIQVTRVGVLFEGSCAKQNHDLFPNLTK